MKKILLSVCLLSVALGCGKLGGGGGNSSSNGVSLAQLLEKQSQQTIDFLRKDNDDYFKAVNTLIDDPKNNKMHLKDLLLGLLEEVKKEISSLVADIKEHRALLLDASGNRNGAEDFGDFDNEGLPLSAHDKGGVRQYFFDDKNGETLRDNIQTTKDAIVEIHSRFFEQYGINPLGIHPNERDAKIEAIKNMDFLSTDSDDNVSWTEKLFADKNVEEAAAVLTSLELDVQLLSSSLLRQLCSDVLTGRLVRFDSFYPVVSPKRNVIRRGETFEAELMVGSYSSSLNPSYVRLSVNGSGLALDKQGKALYKAVPASLGKQRLKCTVAVQNPLTGETIAGESYFEYEVVE